MPFILLDADMESLGINPNWLNEKRELLPGAPEEAVETVAKVIAWMHNASQRDVGWLKDQVTLSAMELVEVGHVSEGRTAWDAGRSCHVLVVSMQLKAMHFWFIRGHQKRNIRLAYEDAFTEIVSRCGR